MRPVPVVRSSDPPAGAAPGPSAARRPGSGRGPLRPGMRRGPGGSPGRAVEHRAGGARVAVARLAHRAGVDQQPHARHRSARGRGRPRPAAACRGRRSGVSATAIGKCVCPKKHEGWRARTSAFGDVAFAEDVGVLVHRRPVADLHAVVHDRRPAGQRRQVRPVLFGQHRPRPLRRALRGRVEASRRRRAPRPPCRDCRGRSRAGGGRVTRSTTSFGCAPYPTRSPSTSRRSHAGAVGEHRLERLEVGVDVAHDEVSHDSVSQPVEDPFNQFLHRGAGGVEAPVGEPVGLRAPKVQRLEAWRGPRRAGAGRRAGRDRPRARTARPARWRRRRPGCRPGCPGRRRCRRPSRPPPAVAASRARSTSRSAARKYGSPCRAEDVGDARALARFDELVDVLDPPSQRAARARGPPWSCPRP